MTSHLKLFTRAIPAVVFLLSLAAADSWGAAIATLRNVSGAVDILKGGKLPASPAKNGDQISAGDIIRTKGGGYVEIAYTDGSLFKVAPGSRLEIGEHFSGKNPNASEVKLARGKIDALVDMSKSPGTPGSRKFEVKTPNAIAGVRGTNWLTSYYRGVTNVLLRIGTVTSYNPARPTMLVTLQPNTITTITGRFAPTPPRPALDRELRNMQVGLTPPGGPPGTGGQSGAGGGQQGTGTGGQGQGTGSQGGSEPGSGQGGGSTGGGSGTGGGTTAPATTDSSTPATLTTQSTTTTSVGTTPATTSALIQSPVVTTTSVALPVINISAIAPIGVIPQAIVPPPPPPPPPTTPKPSTVNVRVGVSF